MNSEKRIIITHCVDPHHFYFKYVDECVNNEYSKFDYVVQCYGNGLHGRQLLQTHGPNKDELVIFFDVISNKWLRGRVSDMNDAEVTLWCIDNGVVRKTEKHFIQPLTENLKKDFNLVQLGGLSVLPAESTLNFETLNVKMEVTHSWDKEMNNNFKMIIGSAKRLNFFEEMQLEEHKFGTLLSESQKDKVVVINEILLQMNKAIACGGSAGMVSYVSERRLKEELYQSLEKANTFSKSIKSEKAAIASNKCEFEIKSVTSQVVPVKEVSVVPVKEVSVVPVKKVSVVPVKEVSLVPVKEDGIELHLVPVKQKDTSKTSSHSTIEMTFNPFKQKKTSGASGKSEGIKWNKFVIPKGTLSQSGKFPETDMHSKATVSHYSNETERSSIQNDGNLKQSADKTCVSSVQTPQNDTDLPSPNQSFDTLENSASMAVSTFCTTESEPKVQRITAKEKPLHIEYECHLKTLKFKNGDTVRQPLQASMCWIQQQHQLLSVADQNESCGSSIVNLRESDDSPLFV